MFVSARQHVLHVINDNLPVNEKTFRFLHDIGRNCMANATFSCGFYARKRHKLTIYIRRDQGKKCARRF